MSLIQRALCEILHVNSFTPMVLFVRPLLFASFVLADSLTAIDSCDRQFLTSFFAGW